MIKFPKKKNINLEKFFIKLGLKSIYDQSLIIESTSKLDKRMSKTPYPPDLLDLYYLHEFIRLNRRVNILEYGCGWSTVMIHFALKDLKSKLKNRTFKRCYNPFQLISLDDDKKFISVSKKRLKTFSKDTKDVKFFYSKVVMDTYNGKYCSKYINHPNINPDFIYIDGPDQFNIKGKINNFTINDRSMVPMISDVLRYEHFLMPGTIIFFDGRQSNVRFFKNNLQRKWINYYINETGQHVFYLNEKPLGAINKEQLAFYKGK